MIGARPPTRDRLLIAGGLLVLCIGGGLAARVMPFLIDDAYIFFRYARNIAAGFGPTYNPGERPVEGFSSALWTAALAFAARTVGSDALPAVARALGLICYVVVLVILARVGRATQAPSKTGARVSALLPAALWGWSGGAIYYACTGMETVSFVLAVAVFHAALAGALPLWAGIVAAAAAPFTRPEASFLFAGAVLQVAADRESRAGIRRTGPAMAMALVAGIAALTLGRLVIFHDWLPNTYYAKRPNLTIGLEYLWSAVRSPVWWPVVAGGVLGAALGESRHRGYAAAALAWTGAAVLEGGDWMPAARLFQPALGLWALAASGVGLAFHSSRRTVGLLSALSVLLAFDLRGALARGDRTAGAQTPHAAEQRQFIEWTKRSHARTIALIDIGELGFACPEVEITDLAGLTDARMGRGPGGLLRKHLDSEYLFGERKPELIQVRLRRLPPQAKAAHPVLESKDALSQVETDVVADPLLARDYRLLFVQAPRFHGELLSLRAIYVRNDFALPDDAVPEAEMMNIEIE